MNRHCIGSGESESGGTRDCGLVQRNYNKPLRIGLLFVVLVTSAFGVFLPIFIASMSRVKSSAFILMILKQFGTGVIISTSLVHVSNIPKTLQSISDVSKLFTHAELLFANECLGALNYEATTAAIVMAGVMLSFLLDYIGIRILFWRASKASSPEPSPRNVADTKSSAERTRAQDTPTTLEVDSECTAQAKLRVVILEAGVIFHSIRKYIIT